MIVMAYVAMVLIWATTPMALQASSVHVPVVWAGEGRVMIGALLGIILLGLKRRPLPCSWVALRTYAFGCINVFVGVFLTFSAARHLASGMICVIFGLSPVVTAVFSRLLLDEPPLLARQWLAAAVGVAGLGIVFAGHLASPVSHQWAVVSALGAVVCFCLGNALIKRYPAQMLALEQTTGTLLMAIPLYGAAGWITNTVWVSPSVSEWTALLYLGVLGSLVGVMCQYYVLSRVSNSTMALSTFLTPPIALALGHAFRHERLFIEEIVGTSCIMLALGLYFSGHQRHPRENNV